ncbi:hypothetical protein [Butyrivibrio sp. YAB3001]|uniref:hypothetical protein n=1 Tax=Butyrivibrio sp. YAB3001 TaxID=1520812 RepID=UPI0008F63F13|nr:hypothetical protein [Butyrivibrio sp. YAB3001]SFC54597.1 hypothetical protein SAMN02910398_02513 [Butyrivibrio sp. YAB3001]
MAMIPEFDSQREKEKYFRSLSPEQKINAFTELIWESEHIVFLGGAGVSTESGTLEVGSAAQLAHMYHEKYMVIINKGKTKMEGKADLVFHDSIGKVMNSLDW